LCYDWGMGKLTEENYMHTVLVFRDRQAGVSEIYDPETGMYSYNAYCLEKKLVKELFTWELESFDQKKGCSSCVAK
jgi:hypothetical protein